MTRISKILQWIRRWS